MLVSIETNENANILSIHTLCTVHKHETALVRSGHVKQKVSQSILIPLQVPVTSVSIPWNIASFKHVVWVSITHFHAW